jgi:hypothetical protein
MEIASTPVIEKAAGFDCLRSRNVPENFRRAPRCLARNRRGLPCMRPALKGKSRCNLHGGRSTGPRTAVGLARSRVARLSHGYYSREAADARRQVRERAQVIRGILGLTEAFFMFLPAPKMRRWFRNSVSSNPPLPACSPTYSRMSPVWLLIKLRRPSIGVHMRRQSDRPSLPHGCASGRRCARLKWRPVVDQGACGLGMAFSFLSNRRSITRPSQFTIKIPPGYKTDNTCGTANVPQTGRFCEFCGFCWRSVFRCRPLAVHGVHPRFFGVSLAVS